MQREERRREVLKFFNDMPESDRFYNPFRHDQTDQEKAEIETACRHLRDLGLIEWEGSIGQDFIGSGRITARGALHHEQGGRPPMSNVFNIGSAQNVQIGDGNTMNVGDIERRVTSAIDASSASPEQKAEAKSLWSRLTNNQTFAAIVGAVAGVATSAAKGS